MNFDIEGISYHVDLWDVENSDCFPLLLLHGFTGDHQTWSPFKKQWSNHSRGIAIDIIGHGKTDSPSELSRYDIQSAAKDLVHILDKLEVESVDLLGYSMGGRLAITFALTYPSKVRKLILESTSPGLESEKDRLERRKKDEWLANRIQEEGIEEFVDYWENIPLFYSQKMLPQQRYLEIHNQRLKNNPIGLANSLKGMGTGVQPSWWLQLEQLTMPTLMITGALDKKFCAISEKMMDKLIYGQAVTIEECGHAIHVEKPEIFGTIVSDFLSHDTSEKNDAI